MISVGRHEMELREQVKAPGGRRHPEAVAWSLPYELIVAMNLTARMIYSEPLDRFGHQEGIQIRCIIAIHVYAFA